MFFNLTFGASRLVDINFTVKKNRDVYSDMGTDIYNKKCVCVWRSMIAPVLKEQGI